MPVAGKWMEFENITSSEIIQAQKDKDQYFSFTCGNLTKIRGANMNGGESHEREMSRVEEVDKWRGRRDGRRGPAE